MKKLKIFKQSNIIGKTGIIKWSTSIKFYISKLFDQSIFNRMNNVTIYFDLIFILCISVFKLLNNNMNLLVQ